MPDYQKGKIYKLWSPQGTEDEIYIGSTRDELRFRKSNHKKKNNRCQSKILFEKYDDIRIEVIEEYPCNSKAELEKKEGEYIRNNKCLNKYIPNRTIKEWREDNKEKIKEYKKKHYKNNKQSILEHHKNNKEKLTEYKKEYRENNKEKIKEYNKEYYKNKTIEKVTCECGCIIRKDGLKDHKKTLKHIKLMEEKIN